MPALSLVNPLMLWGAGGTEASRLLTPCPQPIRRETGPQAPGCQIPKPSTGQAASCQGQSPTDCGLNEERRGSRWTYASPITRGQVTPRLSLQGSSESPLWGWKGIPCPISYMFNAPPHTQTISMEQALPGQQLVPQKARICLLPVIQGLPSLTSTSASHSRYKSTKTHTDKLEAFRRVQPYQGSAQNPAHGMGTVNTLSHTPSHLSSDRALTPFTGPPLQLFTRF